MSTQNLLMLLLLLMLMMRIALSTICCRFRSGGLVIKVKLGLVKILRLKLRQDLKLEFGQYFAADVLQRYLS